MKKIIIGIITIITTVIVIGCAGEEVKADVKTPTIQCGMCQKTIENGLGSVKGVKSVHVSMEDKVAHVVHDPKVANLATIETAISKLGYQANETLADPVAYEALPGCCKVGGGH